MKAKARLVLEDGKVFYGEPFGCRGEAGGEVVFNTGMTGYQELITDPSYCGQIVTLTYPLVGNYGINPHDFQSARPLLKGLVVREYCRQPNHWQSTQTLSAYLEKEGIPGISGVDTRALTRHLRVQGTMKGILTTREEESNETLVERVNREVLSLSEVDHVKDSTTPVPKVLEGSGPPLVLLDLGCKQSIIDTLREKKDYPLSILPAATPAEEIMALRPSGVLISNGPGDPKQVPYVINTVRGLLGKVPLFGICLGHQVIGLALGGDTYKLKFGHRGTNHPVKDLETGEIYITSQNHGYAIDKESLEGLPVEVSHLNLNDQTVEGLRHRELPVSSVQFHPEGNPGPYDSMQIFENFLALL